MKSAQWSVKYPPPPHSKIYDMSGNPVATINLIHYDHYEFKVKESYKHEDKYQKVKPTI